MIYADRHRCSKSIYDKHCRYTLNDRASKYVMDKQNRAGNLRQKDSPKVFNKKAALATGHASNSNQAEYWLSTHNNHVSPANEA
jgi:hypothetical protein